MKQEIHTSKRYGKGSTGFQAAFPPQRIDGRSGGVPRRHHTPSMRKPAVLATKVPEPSQGTHDTAIGADIYHPGPALPRQQRGDVGVEQAQVKRPSPIRRYFLVLVRKHVALTTRRTFGYVRLIAFIIRISRRALFRKPTLPYGMITRFVHDCRFALFRRWAVYAISGNCFESTDSPRPVAWGTAV